MSTPKTDEEYAPDISLPLSIELTIDIPCFCFDVVTRQLFNLNPPITEHLPIEKIPLFVTWRNFNQRLRGCIGTFRPSQFRDDLVNFALASAFQDSRFDPIGINELSHLICSVSILIDFETCSHYLDWEIGRHGIKIYFRVDEEKYSATYLPEVASDHGWNKDVAINSLIRKSGYEGFIDQNLLDSLEVVRYRSVKVSATYRDYRRSEFYTSTVYS